MTSSLYHQSSSTNPPIRKLAECRSVEKSKSSGNHLPSDAFHRMVQFIWKNVKIAQKCEKHRKYQTSPHLWHFLELIFNLSSILRIFNFGFCTESVTIALPPQIKANHAILCSQQQQKQQQQQQLTAAASAAANTNNSKWQMAFSGLKKRYFLFILVAEYHFQVSGISLLDLALPFRKELHKIQFHKNLQI